MTRFRLLADERASRLSEGSQAGEQVYYLVRVEN